MLSTSKDLSTIFFFNRFLELSLRQTISQNIDTSFLVRSQFEKDFQACLLWQVGHFLVLGVFKIATKDPNSGNYGHIFSEWLFWENICLKSAVGLFCCDKFEETSNKKVSDLSKLSKPYRGAVALPLIPIRKYDFFNFLWGNLKF